MTEIQTIALNKIRPGQNDRTRFAAGDLADLAASIKQDGLIQPITARPVDSPDFDFEIIAGERRFRACQILGWTTIPAIIKPMDDRQASRVMLLENLQRADLDPIDEAQAFKTRMDLFGLTVAQMAEFASTSESKIRSRLNLLKLIPEVQHLIRFGNMPLGFAAEMPGLDKNFQLIAMRYFGQTKRPTLAEFRVLCSDLLAKQNQCSMFDMSEFMTAPIAQIAAEIDFKPLHIRQAVVWGVKITVEYRVPRWAERVKVLAGGAA